MPERLNDGQDPSARQTPQGDPQHPQDHADDGADRHRALQEGDGPRHRGRGVHAQDRRAGRRPQRHGAATSRTRCCEARDRSRTVAAAGAHAPTAACAAATTPASSARRPDRPGSRPRASTLHLELSGKRGITFFRYQGCRSSTPTPTSRTSPLRRGRGAGRPLHRGYIRRRDRPGRGGVHEVPQRRPGRSPVVETLLPL